MDATTPMGTRSLRHSIPLLTSSNSPVINCGNEQANSVSSIDFSISACASVFVLPFSSLIRADSSVIFFSSNCLYRKNTCTLSFTVVRLQPINALVAAATAASSSTAPESGTLVSRVPSSGEFTGSIFMFLVASHSPPIKFLSSGYFMFDSPLIQNIQYYSKTLLFTRISRESAGRP